MERTEPAAAVWRRPHCDHTMSDFRIDLIPAQKWWTPPVPYNSNVLYCNSYATALLCQVDDIVDRVRRLRPEIEAELTVRFHASNDELDQEARKARAEEIVVELYEVYLYLKMHYARLENTQYTELLCLIVHTCENHGLDRNGYVEYAIGEYVMFSQAVKDFFYFLNPISGVMPEFNIIYHTFRDRRQTIQAEVISFNQLDTLEFILKHANNLRFEVSCTVDLPVEDPQEEADDAIATSSAGMTTVSRHFRIETPFVDLPSKETFIGMVTPVALACMYAEHDATLLLLRYGAMPMHMFASKDLYRQQREQPIYIVVNNINPRVDRLLLEQRPVTTTEIVPSNSLDILGSMVRQATRFILCLQYMLRADPYLNISYCGEYNPATGHVDAMEDAGPSASASAAHSRRTIVIDSRVKERFLPSCLTDDMPSLLRVCRYAIRRALRRTQQLPAGIKELPLPALLKSYVDLLQD